MIVTTFHCIKSCTCSARGLRQPLLSLVVRDTEEEMYSPERIFGTEYTMKLYPAQETDSLVICADCRKPWTMTVVTDTDNQPRPGGK